MNEVELGELLLSLSFVFILTFIFGYILSLLRIPVILAALFAGMLLSNTPFYSFVHSLTAFESAFSFLSDLGVLFLLFYIGLQIESGQMRALSKDIIWVTVLNTVLPFIFGVAAMYRWRCRCLTYNRDHGRTTTFSGPDRGCLFYGNCGTGYFVSTDTFFWRGDR